MFSKVPSPLLRIRRLSRRATSEFAKATGISSICVRLLGMYGPFQDPTQFSLAPRSVHAALNGKPPNLESIFLGNADDAVDLCYIKDVARAIALLQTAEKLQYDVYNIGSGRLTPNRELVEAIKRVVPNFKMDLPPGIDKVELAIFRKSANSLLRLDCSCVEIREILHEPCWSNESIGNS
ncbi:MAG TPA: NAD(P)-dependent oxidoreductase [Candidatus Bathyarchaeia archaeon]